MNVLNYFKQRLQNTNAFLSTTLKDVDKAISLNDVCKVIWLNDDVKQRLEGYFEKKC